MDTIVPRSPSLAHAVAERLRGEIGDGQYRSGEKLPTERELSGAYGVSRAIIREALGRLKQDGLVVSRQGSGAFVVEAAPAVFRLRIDAQSNSREIQNVVELLTVFESAASGLAAVRRTQAQLAEITRQFDAMEEAIADRRLGIDEDVAFHRAIVDATANPIFQDLFDVLDNRVRGFIGAARVNTARQDGMSRTVQNEHLAILEAIRAGDEGRARTAATTHLRNAMGRLRSA